MPKGRGFDGWRLVDQIPGWASLFTSNTPDNGSAWDCLLRRFAQPPTVVVLSGLDAEKDADVIANYPGRIIVAPDLATYKIGAPVAQGDSEQEPLWPSPSTVAFATWCVNALNPPLHRGRDVLVAGKSSLTSLVVAIWRVLICGWSPGAASDEARATDLSPILEFRNSSIDAMLSFASQNAAQLLANHFPGCDAESAA